MQTSDIPFIVCLDVTNPLSRRVDRDGDEVHVMADNVGSEEPFRVLCACGHSFGTIRELLIEHGDDWPQEGGYVTNPSPSKPPIVLICPAKLTCGRVWHLRFGSHSA